MHEDRRRDREERDAPVEREIAQEEIELRGEKRAEQADEEQHAGAARERIRDHGEDRQAHVAKRIDRVPDMDPVHVGQRLGVELVVPLTRVVVREIEIVIEDDALHDDQVVRLVGGRRRDRPVIGQHHERGREQRRAEQDRRARIAEARNYGPQRLQRIHGEPDRDEQVCEAELRVGDEEAPRA